MSEKLPTPVPVSAYEWPVDLWEAIAVGNAGPSRLGAFWTSLRTADQAKLAKRCPFFDPAHSVWSNGQFADAAFRQLKLIMADDLRKVMPIRLFRRTTWTLLLALVGGIAIFFATFYETSVSNWVVKSSIICLSGSGAVFLGECALHAVRLWSLSRRTPRLEYSPISRKSNGGYLDFLETMDYRKNWAAIEHWKKEVSAKLDGPIRLWAAASEAVEDGQLLSNEKRRLFWDVMSGGWHVEFARLAEHFDPDSQAWELAGPEGEKRLELELDLLMVGKTLRAIYQDLTFAALIDCSFTLAFEGAEIFALALGSAVTVPSAIAAWKGLRRRKQLRRELNAMSSA